MRSKTGSMHYKLSSGIVIKTENAAKTESQPSKFLLNLIGSLARVASTFDYGCGKLRYERAIADRTDTLAIIDSEIQLSRPQMLRGKQISIRNIFRQSNHVQIYNDLQFKKINARFDRGFCINVISVIPSYAGRRRVFEAIRQRLAPDGECLFAVQYRNSDFTRMRKMPNATPWLDGFLVDSLRGYSFYGMIPPERLESSLKRAGFRIRETILNDGSAYIWAAVT
jgi:SAM-dependent methyltransferase